ncbi:MAG: NAD-dependent DNA ligase LigA, partial [Bacteroidota bacterium]
MNYTATEQRQLVDQSKTWLTREATIGEIEALRQALRFHEWRYSVQNDPVLSDYEYDQLYKQLEALETAHPSVITQDSPTQRVSSDLSGNFPPIRHLTPMLSLDNSYDAEDLLKFDESIKKLTGIEPSESIAYCVEPKYDGGSVALVYENDLLTRAATRGNGTEGEDITLNARTLASVPLSAPWSDANITIAEIRGEAVIRKDRFEIINKRRSESGKELFANPRNSAAGGLRMKKASDTRDRGIEIFAFQLGHAVDQDGRDVLQEINTHEQQINLLASMGFKVHDPSELVCKDIHEVIKAAQQWEKKRGEYPYEIDGLVIKVNRRDLQERCGYTSHHPRWAIAYKFKAKQATTTLERVEYQVGKVGSITPVAKVTPVSLAGVTVSSISMHNEEFILQKDLHLGDQIVIERAGDVIPYIVKALSDLRVGTETPIRFPEYCPIHPVDKIKLVRVEDEAAWRCPNCTCGIQNLQRMIFHVSKSAMDIDGFGKSIVERFYDLGWLRDIADIYNLDYDQIQELEGFGSKSVDKLRSSINQAKKNPISRLLHSLSIHHLGKRASQLIAERIDHVLDLSTWQPEQFTNIKDIGPVVARNVSDWFTQESNIDMLRRMESYGVDLHQKEADRPVELVQDAPLSGKTILFTGSLQQMTRN